jgi:hypothetical protein
MKYYENKIEKYGKQRGLIAGNALYEFSDFCTRRRNTNSYEKYQNYYYYI